jgi:hypothetical protein
MNREDNKYELLVIELNLSRENDEDIVKVNDTICYNELHEDLKNSFKDKIIIIKAFFKNKNNNSLI